MSKIKKPKRGNLLEIWQRDSPSPEPKAGKLHHGYGNPDEVRRRASQAGHVQRWRERKQLELLGYDELD